MRNPPRSCAVLALSAGVLLATGLLALGCEEAPESAAPEATPAASETVPPPAIVPATPVQPALADFTPTATGPQLEFNTLMYDFGRIWDVGAQQGVFSFRNVGTETVQIHMVKPGCGCTTTTLDQFRYEPGEGNEIQVEFRPAGHGQQTKGITILSNSVKDPELKLRITANITEFVKVEPRYMRTLPVDLGIGQVSSFTFTCPDPNLVVDRVTTSGMQGNSITARVMKAGETRLNERGESFVVAEGEYAIEVTVLPDAPWGALYGAIEVHCRGTLPEGGEPIEHIAKCNIATSVYGVLEASDNMIRPRIVPPGGPINAEIELSHRGGKPFNVIEARVLNARPPMRMEIIPIPGSGGSRYTLRVVGESGTYLGNIAGTAEIMTDIPGEENLRFRVAGVVRSLPPRK